MEKEMNITAGYRKQWVGLNGSPSTSYLTLNTALNNKKNAMSRPGALKDSAASYSIADPHHAIGFTIINDEAGALNRFVSYATYAYHVPLSSTVNLSAGISGGISSINVHQAKLELENPVDPAVYNYTGRAKLDMNVGICLYGENFFTGISIQQIIPQDVKTNGNPINIYGDRKFPDLFLSGGVSFNMSNDITFSPSVMLKYINTVPLTFDVNGKIGYKNLCWAGYSYRYKSGMAVMAGIKIKDAVRFGYSYDLTTSGLQTVSKGTHELLLAFLIKRK